MKEDSFFSEGDELARRGSVMAPGSGIGLVYVGRPWAPQDMLVAYPDREVVADKRERAICKALLQHALDLIEEAEGNGE